MHSSLRALICILLSGLPLFGLTYCNPYLETSLVKIKTLDGKWTDVMAEYNPREMTFNHEDFCYEMVYDSAKNSYVGIPLILFEDELCRIDTMSLNIQSFNAICELYNIREPEYVYAQAKLESGNFTSKVFRTKNNFLGLRGKNGYFSFDYWADCIRCYAGCVERHRKPDEEFLPFLRRRKYAEDEAYLYKVKNMIDKNHDTWINEIENN